MAKAELSYKQDILERNIALTGTIMRFLMENPTIFASLPERFELVVLPEDDPEIRQYNLELLDKYGSEGKPIVFARIKAHPEDAQAEVKPSLFVPLSLAA